MTHFTLKDIDGVEKWLPVVGYEGLYIVSNRGNVKSLDRKTVHKNGRVHYYKGTILKPHVSPYPQVGMNKDGVHKNKWVHALVCEAFIGPKPNGGCVNHKDGVKTNNRIDNLEYLSLRDNALHAIKTGLMSTVGSRNHHAKLNEKKVKRIREMYKQGYSYMVIGFTFGIKKGTVGSVLSRRRWSHVK